MQQIPVLRQAFTRVKVAAACAYQLNKTHCWTELFIGLLLRTSSTPSPLVSSR